NVTPLVDVVLVLLIIFLAAMPILMKDINIEVPKKSDEQVPPDMVPDQLTVEIKEGHLLLNGTDVDPADLATTVRERLDRKREKVVFVDFDTKYPYGQAVHIMDVCRGAGATTVAIKMKDENADKAVPTQPAP